MISAMILLEDTNSGDYRIRAYRPGVITINDKDYMQSLIIAAHALVDHWQPQSLNALLPEHFDAILVLKPEIVILGTGKHFALLPEEQLRPLTARNIGVECMDTGAACRTYTALASEGRAVVAALLID